MTQMSSRMRPIFVRPPLNCFKASFSSFTLVCTAVNKLIKSPACVLTKVDKIARTVVTADEVTGVLVNILLTAVVTEILNESVVEVLVLVVVGTVDVGGLKESLRGVLAGVVVGSFL